MISIIQTIFIVSFFFVPIPIYAGLLMLGYSTVFTMMPVFSLILDEDCDAETVLEFVSRVIHFFLAPALQDPSKGTRAQLKNLPYLDLYQYLLGRLLLSAKFSFFFSSSIMLLS